MTTMRDDLEERFLRYVQIDTESQESSPTVPSTAKQFDLLNLLAEEMRELGVADVKVTDYGCAFGTVPAAAGLEDAPVVAFFAHVDTTEAFTGANVKPIVHRNYDGQPIVLSGNPELVLDFEIAPYLEQKVGEDIVTTDGTTLLGADDKAGVAIIMGMAKYLLAQTEVAHGPVRLCFSTDEEIGRGMNHIDLSDVAADVAYTLDAGPKGEVIYETFSADKAIVRIDGVPAHPGYAKGVLVNALHLVAKFIARLPQSERTPETTTGREGFIHVTDVNGNATAATVQMILRDFERDGLAAHGDLVRQVAAEIQELEPRAKVHTEITAQYRNMRYWLEDDMRPVDLAAAATRAIGMEPISSPIRGGTDGSRLTEMGLPTPNLFTGMQNFHSPLEWVSLHDMEKSTEMCIKLAELWGQESK